MPEKDKNGWTAVNDKLVKVLHKRAIAEQQGTTPIFFNDEIDCLLEEIKRLGGASDVEMQQEKVQAINAYRCALAVLCQKSKRKGGGLKLFPKDLKVIDGKHGNIIHRWLEDGSLELFYTEEIQGTLQ